MQITRSATTCISFPPKPGWAEFGRKLGGLYDDNVKDVSGSACAINKMEEEVVLHTQEVTGSSPVAPTIIFNNLHVVERQTAHPTAHPVPELLPDFFAPILRAWRRTQPRIIPRTLLPPAILLILVPHLPPSSRSTFATSDPRPNQKS